MIELMTDEDSFDYYRILLKVFNKELARKNALKHTLAQRKKLTAITVFEDESEKSQ